MKPAPDPVVSISRGRNPVRDAAAPAPCPSSVVAVLGVDVPTRVRCGLLAGHVGNHAFHIEWGGAS